MSIIVGIAAEHPQDEPMAEQMLADLCVAYPGHAWFVLVRGGVVQIKNMDWSANWGMALHYSQIKGDAAERKRDVLRAAGEFLERANVARASKTEQRVTQIEGVPDKAMARAAL